MASSKVGESFHIDPDIWKACAGSCVQIPAIGSRVYYFPQGHGEQSSSPVHLSPSVCFKPLVLCRVVSIWFLADPDTDEVFAKIFLVPIDQSRAGIVQTVKFPDYDGEEKVASFVKVLTPSDANNGGGFSVPKFCADMIFPPLNYKADPPVQMLSVRDVHGVLWEFRHIYRGTPRRHLLTTGWSKFVNQKKLVARDSVVFMKNRSGDLFVGIRRTGQLSRSGDYHISAFAAVKGEDEFGNGERFLRSSKGRISAESVMEAAELAAADKPFDIVYYPRAGLPDFVVKAEMVEGSMDICWTAGMKIKMALETEDSSRMTWYQGNVSSAMVPAHVPWHGSPWRMLQVIWDEPDAMQNIKRVSPWQVELVTDTPPLQNPFPSTKKLKVSQNPELLTDGEGPMLFPMTGLVNSMMGNLSPSLSNLKKFPAGMQGARHDTIGVSSINNFVANYNHHMNADHLFDNMVQKLNSVSTELNIGSTSQSEYSSPHSQGSVHFFDTELFGNRTCSSSTKAGFSSFRLFGKIIQTEQPVESGFDDVGCTEDNGSKGSKETEGVNNTLDPFLYKDLYNRLDVSVKEFQLSKRVLCEGTTTKGGRKLTPYLTLPIPYHYANENSWGYHWGSMAKQTYLAFKEECKEEEILQIPQGDSW
ncbi:hypothetical protein HHK36_030372 [Tetracentron sinense]|uniref:Auxin response factor n=1 Tax=Tetracentron sinense TaxID=13715 RepID=A0A834YAZ8_TETSI|nr:hypothetical protein HHK36_030372 [Tetracentron sinense]